MHVPTTLLPARRHVGTVSLGKGRDLSVSCEKRWGIRNCKLTGIPLSSSAIPFCQKWQVPQGRNVIAALRCFPMEVTPPPCAGGSVADVAEASRSGGPDSEPED